MPFDPMARLGRRLLLLRLGGSAGIAAALAGCEAPAAAPVASPVPVGRAAAVATDSDPYDAPGRGRAGGPRARPGEITGITDQDPADPPNAGLGERRPIGTRPSMLIRQPPPDPAPTLDSARR